jgi:hypothetical protein
MQQTREPWRMDSTSMRVLESGRIPSTFSREARIRSWLSFWMGEWKTRPSVADGHACLTLETRASTTFWSLFKKWQGAEISVISAFLEVQTDVSTETGVCRTRC